MAGREKHVLLGVAGGIAAYKSAALASLLVRRGARVRVIMTRAATSFVGPLTFQSLTREPVLQEELTMDQEEQVAVHVAWARWAHTTIVAPATADLIGRAAAGLADDLLTATLLCVRGRRLLAPAMNQLLWTNPLVRRNLEVLVAQGWEVVGPEEGPLADGDSGPGRMSEPETLADRVLRED